MSKFKAVVFDWAGTMIDFGSFAPMGVFVKAFAEFGVEVTIEEAREPMGKPKWDHIHSMLSNPRVAEAWQAAQGNAADNAAVDRIYEVFVPMNEAVVADYASLVPGAIDTINYLNEKNIKIGSTTGYTRSIMERVFPIAKEQGYEPLNCICADDLPEGRPGPIGMYQTMVDLVVYPPAAVIKVDDTEPGIAEGVAAGCLTVGLALSGNFVGKTPEQLAELSEAEVEVLRKAGTERLKAAGADYVIDSVADLPRLLNELGA